MAKKVYRYQLEADYHYRHPVFDGIEFENEWCLIRGGEIVVKQKYATDGCSPKWQPFGLITLGTPDGALHFGLPWTYYASLIHDVLCQFSEDIPISRADSTQVFKDILDRDEWPLTALYVGMVHKFGPRNFRGRNNER
jgi:hypothetical protein